MPSTLKGPGIFISQFAGDEPPFDTWPAICRWAAELGYKGIQLPSADRRFFDLQCVGRVARRRGRLRAREVRAHTAGLQCRKRRQSRGAHTV